jgi:hypothetical protein
MPCAGTSPLANRYASSWRSAPTPPGSAVSSKQLGHQVIVANARKVRLIYANDSKTDKVDAETLGIQAGCRSDVASEA